MQQDDIIVEHDGKRWLVEDGRLVPFREVIIDMPRTPEEYAASMASALPILRAKIHEYMARNDPFMPNF